MLVGDWHWILDSGFWTLDLASWILDSGFWILDSGFWILEFGFWIPDSGFWILEISDFRCSGNWAPEAGGTAGRVMGEPGGPGGSTSPLRHCMRTLQVNLVREKYKF